MTEWRKAADNAEFAALTNDAGLFITGKKDEMDQLLDYLNALTSERDEAVRVAGELRALAEKMAPHIVAFRTDTDVIHAYGHASHPIAKAVQCSICYLRAEVDALLGSLTASTGGSAEVKDEEES